MTIRELHRGVPRGVPGRSWRLLASAASWPVSSQQHARHNALAASTALGHRRRERLEVEAYLGDLEQQRARRVDDSA